MASARVPATSPFLRIPPATWSAAAQMAILSHQIFGGRVSRSLGRHFIPGPSLRPDLEALAAFMGNGSRGFGIVLFAVLANHIRRILLPELGIGGFGGVIAGVKLAKGSPEIFLREEFEGLRWWMGPCKVLGDLGGLVAGNALFEGMQRWEARERGKRAEIKQKERGKKSEITIEERRAMQAEERWEEKVCTVAAVVVLVWVLGAAEYVHARAVHALDVGIAYWRMGGGGEVHREALWRIFVPVSPSLFSSSSSTDLVLSFIQGFWATNENKIAIIFFHLELAWYLRYGLCPLLRLAIFSALGLGRKGQPRPGMAVVLVAWAWGTGYVAKYSNKYHIGLEMSDGLLVAWWICAAVMVFGWVWARRVVGWKA